MKLVCHECGLVEEHEVKVYPWELVENPPEHWSGKTKESKYPISVWECKNCSAGEAPYEGRKLSAKEVEVYYLERAEAYLEYVRDKKLPVLGFQSILGGLQE